jgi:uncharacterized protein YutE (UPF0331/DUF86 family)
MIRPEIIRRRLNKLDEYISILQGLRKYTFEAFVSDPEHYGSTERFLQLAIETVIDMGNHLIADENLGIVNWYSDIPKILTEKGYIDELLREKWIKMIGFRNTMVHDYIDIDRHIVYDILQNNLDDFEELRQIFAQFL